MGQYLERFNKIRSSSDLYRLNGGRVIVEVLPPEELKTQGGLIMVDTKQGKSDVVMNKAMLGIVVLTGVGYTDENGADVPIDVQAGNVIMFNELSARYFSSFPGIKGYTKNSLALIADSDIQMVFPSENAYKEYCVLMDGPTTEAGASI